MYEYIEMGSKFLEMNRDVSLKRLKSLVGKKVFADLYEEDYVGVSTSTLEILEVNNKNIKVKERGFEDIIDIKGIRGLDEIINYNDREIDFESYKGKKVRLTDKNGITETVEIQDVGKDKLFLGFDYEKEDGEIYRSDYYEYPMDFVKDIK